MAFEAEIVDSYTGMVERVRKRRVNTLYSSSLRVSEAVVIKGEEGKWFKNYAPNGAERK